MNEHRLRQLFEDATVPESNEMVRARIKREAMAAFISASTQESKQAARPTETTSVVHNKGRGNLMNNHTFAKRPVWTRRIAGGAMLVLVMGISLTLLMDSPYHQTLFPSSDSPAALNGTVAKPGEAADIVLAVSPPVQDRSTSTIDAATQPGTAAETRANLPTHREEAAGRFIGQAAVRPKFEFYSVLPTLERTKRDRFSHYDESAVTLAAEQPLSTFSIDVDTASYSFVRRQLNSGVLPAEDAVRVEEMINYFDYHYPPPRSADQPFATHVNVVDSPWKSGNKLVHIGIKGYEIEQKAQPDSNLVFLLDVSGSMDAPDKLPLVKQSLGLLLQSLKPTDTVAIVVYAGAAGAVLEPTQVKDSNKILAALEQLQAGGATDGAQGLALAYQLAERNFRKEAINRVMLATDGDFNVGITQDESLEDFVARKRETGIYLSVFGFGEGNYQDALMQALAQNGNGVAAYIDTLGEAQKLLVDEATRALFPIANDVKIQVEFNPATVAEYRLIGYETRALEREDFNNDKVDAGDIGAGHTVTAIYEVTPVNSEARLVDDSRYKKAAPEKTDNQELGFLKLRYKLPGETQSRLVSTPIVVSSGAREQTNVEKALQAEINFSVAVAGFGQILRGGKHTGDWSYDDVIAVAQSNKGDDEYGYRTEFVQLARKAKTAQGM